MEDKKNDNNSGEQFVFVTEEEFKKSVKKPKETTKDTKETKWETGKGVPVDSQKIKWAAKY